MTGTLAVLALVAALQAERPQLEASVDEDRVSVGEEVPTRFGQ